MQGLNEPVSLFQTKTNISESDLKKILHHAGLKTGYAPDEYIIRKTQDGRGANVLELITPFYSPESARKNIETLTGYLAEHGVKFAGVIKPATYSQINPTPKQRIARNATNDARIAELIKRKLYSKNSMHIDTFYKKYAADENKGKHLFRGQTFATSDPKSSYATPTWRTGRTGIVYAAPNPHYAQGYATNTSYTIIAGNTMNTDLFLLKYNGLVVGVITVFQNSKRNINLNNSALEDASDKRDLKNKAKHPIFQETIVSPHNNPIVARYLAIGDRVVLIDDNDDTWREILDYMAPNMEATHIYGMKRQHYGTVRQDYHGKQFLQRMDKLAHEISESDNGQVNTHDLPPEILEKMGYRPPREQFARATAKILQQTTYRPINTAQHKKTPTFVGVLSFGGDSGT